MGVLTDGNDNTAIGYYSLGSLDGSSSNNVAIGNYSGFGVRTGNGNVYIGNYSGSGSISTENNRLYISNTYGNNPLIYGEFDKKNLNINVDYDKFSRATIFSASNGLSGLRFRNLTSSNIPGTNPGNGVLTVDGSGDVILVTDQAGSGGTGGIMNSCTTVNIVPKVVDSSGNLGCSQIFDDGTSVGIDATGPFTYSFSSTPPFSGGSYPLSGIVKLDVNGVIRTVGIFATSDKKFKKEIKPISDGLSVVQSLNGKTYKWDREANKSMHFDDAMHSGFIAQDIEKVLPHVVATDSNGNKAVNYLEVVPYLVEAIKEQQAQIDELKSQLSDSFKAVNTDLINLQNTKIISVSPNPSSSEIAVSFNIDKSVASAKLMVYDLAGNVLSSMTVNDRDNNLTRTFQKDNLGAGVYIVSLVVNGKGIDSKKIIFN